MRAEDLLVGHRCPEDAQGIAQERIVCTLERSLARDDVEREQLIKLQFLLLLGGLGCHQHENINVVAQKRDCLNTSPYFSYLDVTRVI